MLLVSTLILLQATFAWLVLSTAPEVAGADTQVSVNGSLEIALLNAETFADVNTVRSGIGTSAAVSGTLAANEAWGNIVDLSDVSYGLPDIVLRPAVLSMQDGIIKDNILNMPSFGEDGRIIGLIDGTQTRICSSGGAFEDFGYGVRAIGPVSTDPASGANEDTVAVKEAITTTLGYAIDLSVKTSGENSHLLLQTEKANRIYSDGADATMGGGSSMQFRVQELEQENAAELIRAIRVVFAEPIPDGYRTLAIAQLDAGQMTPSEDGYQAPLYLENDPDNTAIITGLEKDRAKKITTIVYLDGRYVQNSAVSAVGMTSLTGSLNLQFASDAELLPADITEVRSGNISGALVEHEIASGSAGESVTWSLSNEGRLTISGTGAMDDFAENLTGQNGMSVDEGIPVAEEMSADEEIPAGEETLPDEKEPAPWSGKALSSAIRSIVVNSGVTHIGSNAFSGCTNLTSVSLPAGMQQIGDNAFFGCTALKQIVWPASVTVIGASAFAGCTELVSISAGRALTALKASCLSGCASLTTIFYGGTIAEWGAVEKGENWNKGADRCIIRCTDGDTGSTVKDSDKADTDPSDPSAGTGTETPDETIWTLYENGTLIIGGAGAMRDYDSPEKAPWHNSRPQIKTLIIDSGITTISKNAFADCVALQSVILPDTLLSIGESAFRGCTALKEVTIPNIVQTVAASAFENCTALSLVHIGDGVTSIGNRAFANTAVSSISIENGLKKIGMGAFAGCGKLSNVTLGYGIRSIGAEAFKDCTGLSSIVYNGTTLKWFFVGKGADWDKNTGAYQLSCVDGLTIVSTDSIGDVTWTLYDNSDYTDGLLCIDGTGSVTAIPWREYASQIRTVNIGSGITGFCENAFLECVNLKDVNYAGTPGQWAGMTFANAYANPVSVTGNLTFGGETVTDLTFAATVDEDGNEVPDAITRINEYAFYNLGGLKSVSVPSSVTDIQPTAFEKCSALTTITVDEENEYYCNLEDGGSAVYTADQKTLLWCSPAVTGVFEIPDTVEEIAPAAFAGCAQITELVLPVSVRSLGAGAFDDCSALQKVTYAGTVTDWMDIAIADEYATPMRYASSITLAGSRFSGLDFSDTKVFTTPVSSVPDFCFYGWDSLSSVTIPATLTQIGTGAFAACGSLHSFIVDENNPSFLSNSHNSSDGKYYDGLLFSKDRSEVVVCGGGYSIDRWHDSGLSQVTVIRDFAFSGCEYSGYGDNWPFSLDAVTAIGRGAFENCITPDKIEGLNNLVTIGTGAFANCTTLYKLEGMNSLATIGAGAFANCTNLFKLEVSAPALQSIGTLAFEGCGALYLDYSGTRTQWVQVVCETGWRNAASPDVRTAGGDYGYFGDLVWEFTTDGVLTVSGDAPMPNERSPWADWDCVTSLVLKNGVRTISDGAFSGCDRLTSAPIPTTVSAIGDSAFFRCTGLPSVTVPGSVKTIGDYAFFHCRTLTALSLQSGIEEIGDNAFRECYELTSVTVPSSVKIIGDGAFYDCRSLSKATILSGVETIGDSAFHGCTSLPSVTIPGSIKTIGDGAFGGCAALTELSLQNGIEEIGSGAFYGCYKLPSVAVPASVKTIGDYAFSGCTALASLSLQDGIEEIGNDAFSGCRSLSAVTIPSSVAAIGSSAFSGCTSLAALTIEDGVKTIGDRAFVGCTNLIGVTVPSSVTSIGNASFGGCSILSAIRVEERNKVYQSLDGVVYTKDGKKIVAVPGAAEGSFAIPETVTSVGPGAFYGCSKLTSITLPDGLTDIGTYAFYGCSEWTGALEIPAGVSEIRKSAFSACVGLTSVTIADSVAAIRDDAFRGCTSLTTVTIPASVKSIYTGAYYDSFGQCTALRDVYYGGTQEQWEKLVPKTSSSGLLKATVHFGQP